MEIGIPSQLNDVVKAIRQLLHETDRYLLKQVLKQWEERIVATFCAGVTTVRHRRRERRGDLLLKNWTNF